MQDDREERIRRRAHEIWEREGQPEGRHDEHWARATAEIDAEGTAAGTGTGRKKGAATKPRTTAETAQGAPARTGKIKPESAGSGAKAAKTNGSASKGTARAKAAVGGALPAGTATRGRTARAAKKGATS